MRPLWAANGPYRVRTEPQGGSTLCGALFALQEESEDAFSRAKLATWSNSTLPLHCRIVYDLLPGPARQERYPRFSRFLAEAVRRMEQEQRANANSRGDSNKKIQNEDDICADLAGESASALNLADIHYVDEGRKGMLRRDGRVKLSGWGALHPFRRHDDLDGRTVDFIVSESDSDKTDGGVVSLFLCCNKVKPPSLTAAP